MSVDSNMDLDAAQAETTSVAVAVKGGAGGEGGRGSRRAVRWALENVIPKPDRFVLIHVIPSITSIPTPSGNLIPVEDLDANVVAIYVQDTKAKSQELFIPFKKLCKTRKMEILVLEGDNPASVLLRYISDSGITSLVLGSCSSNWLTRKLKGPTVPSTVLKHAPGACNIFVVSRYRLITNSANHLLTTESCSRYWFFSGCGARGINKLSSGLYSYSLDSTVHNTSGVSSVPDRIYPNSQAYTCESPSIHSSAIQKSSCRNLGDTVLDAQSVNRCPSVSSTFTDQSYMQTEVEQLRLELQSAATMYNQACEELVHAQNKVHMLSSDVLAEAIRVSSALKREENYKKIAAEEKEKHLEMMNEVERARSLLAKEAYEREIAEGKALKVSLEKQKIADTLFSSDRRYRRYTMDEIEAATEFLSETKVIGEGAYGKVYKCNLDRTPVAIKVLRSDASEKRHEFLREVEVLSQLRHPNMVLLLGACPETSCLVYEYMENGSLEDYISRQTIRSLLPWFTRFQIVFEVACGLAFLHNSKPEPIVHRDLKPGNILLDRNFMSKIGDVGLAKLVSDVVPDNITEYRETVLAGTLYYMDPEYLRTGTVRPKSDLYAFGIIILQLLTSRQAKGLLLTVENAIASDSFSDVLDNMVTDWPVVEAKELAVIAMKCSSLRCRDRPDLDTEVLPVLKRLADFADASKNVERNNMAAPSHYYCPILQEVMDDPHIAADGFTYDHKAIEVWLERHDISPVTRHTLQHKILTPNHTLHSAIQEWRSIVASSKS